MKPKFSAEAPIPSNSIARSQFEDSYQIKSFSELTLELRLCQTHKIHIIFAGSEGLRTLDQPSAGSDSIQAELLGTHLRIIFPYMNFPSHLNKESLSERPRYYWK